MLTREEVLTEMRNIYDNEADAQDAADEYLTMRWEIDWQRRIQFLVLDTACNAE